ncbi:MAG: 3' terminal RNA ribose 2'-O-methyltransferase Hen1 [Firmicutes bacterium]|nr:3' terminal RNA ribose 2'-O-methyltransferase Hen1 [Bacillota bacterium]
MILTITTTYHPATDLGYLLHKHPDKVQTFPLPFGQALVFFPEAGEDRCTAALLLDIDPIGIVRSKTRNPPVAQHYVNDRPYTVSSFMSVAIAKVFGTALSGNCRAREYLPHQAIWLEAYLGVLPSDGGEPLIRRIFEPLGYTLRIQKTLLDPLFADWGEAPYYAVTLQAETSLYKLLNHLYVLIPVLDNDKHYYISDDEVEKLLHHGEGWLKSHPERETITWRYLKHNSRLTTRALSLLEPTSQSPEDASERPLPLREQRIQAVLNVLKKTEVSRILDLGCGEGGLLNYLVQEPLFKELVGLDISLAALRKAHKRLDAMPERLSRKVKLWHGSLIYRDRRLEGFDAAVLMEVIEHIEPELLSYFERALFEYARPRVVILTTPNKEYNSLFASLAPNGLRHADHRFEWTRQEFGHWTEKTANRFGYQVRTHEVGAEDPTLGSPTQMGVFQRNDG